MLIYYYYVLIEPLDKNAGKPALEKQGGFGRFKTRIFLTFDNRHVFLDKKVGVFLRYQNLFTLHQHYQIFWSFNETNF
jgi:hypothetical protein